MLKFNAKDIIIANGAQCKCRTKFFTLKTHKESATLNDVARTSNINCLSLLNVSNQIYCET